MGKSVLIADSDEATGSLLKSMLEAKGHSVSIISDGRSVVEAARQQADMIIVGEQLTDIDGVGLIVKLRSTTRSAKVVFISNQWKESEVYQLLTKEYGVSLVVNRPLKTLILGAQLESLLTADSLGSNNNNADQHEKFALQALQSRFLEGLPARMAAIHTALDYGRASDDNFGYIEEAVRLAHNLKGTASTCGHHDLMEAALALEKYLAEMKKSVPGTTEQWDHAQQLFELLVALCQRRCFDGVKPAVIDDSAMAKILVVGNNFDADTKFDTGGLAVKFISTTAGEALEKASTTALDAVLIDLESTSDKAPVALARELRGMTGNESLPLGFIKRQTGTMDRVEAAHAGASLFLERPLQPDAVKNGIEYLLAVRQGGRPRVLVVDDDPDFSSLIVSTLGREGMLVKCINDPTLTMTTMEAFVPDLILLDVMMPVLSGFDVCKMLRSNARWVDTPILFLTAETELDARLAAFDAGGDDYLPKPVAPVELLTRVKVRLERARLMRERADKDVLSGLLLRRAFMEQVTGLISEAERHKFMFTIALIDVDKFKQVNDKYGHLAGDRVLARLGQLLKRRFRVEDIRGRWGGEEFIVAFRHEAKQTSEGALSRVLDEFRKMDFEGDHGERFNVSFTAGLASFPEDGDSLEKLVHSADARLYAGKEAGRNRIIVTG